MGRGAVATFTHEIPSVESYWRAIILFGKNAASYKFALAGSLLELGRGSESVGLDELAVPFAHRVADHLRTHDKQGASERSRFLDACRAFNRGELDESSLQAATVKLGFVNVIDAFHIVDGSEVDDRFFIDERRSGKGIRLTDQLRKLMDQQAAGGLDEELEARWRLVETAWALNLPRQLLTVEYEPEKQDIVVPRRRTAITGARGALNGYQKGHCFYCFRRISVVGGALETCQVDHVFPWSPGRTVGGAPIDGVWNLVLACPRCNSWHEKSDRPPARRYVERLLRRNEFLIASDHPLKPTLIAQTGRTKAERFGTLKKALREVTVGGARREWTAPEEMDAAF
jgi:HNH endonuclease